MSFNKLFAASHTTSYFRFVMKIFTQLCIRAHPNTVKQETYLIAYICSAPVG